MNNMESATRSIETAADAQLNSSTEAKIILVNGGTKNHPNTAGAIGDPISWKDFWYRSKTHDPA